MNTNKINLLLSEDNEKIDRLIDTFPVNLPVSAIADFLSMDPASVRAAIENNAFGISWKKPGNARHAYFVPTTQFVRWYLNM